MKTIITLVLSIAIGYTYSQENKQNINSMKMNAGIITNKLAETKYFYTKVLDFEVVFENDFYLLLRTPSKSAELSFLLPNHPSQQPIFQSPFNGKGVYITIEVHNVDEFYKRLRDKGVEVDFSIRDEPWGDRHFAIVDPNGIGIDIVTYKNPE